MESRWSISQGEISKDIRPGKVNGNMSCYCLQILDNTLWYRVVLTEECRWILRAIFEALLQSAASLRPSRLPSTSNFLKPNQPFPFDRLLGRKIENLRREKRAADKASPRIPSPHSFSALRIANITTVTMMMMVIMMMMIIKRPPNNDDDDIEDDHTIDGEMWKDWQTQFHLNPNQRNATAT